MSAFNQHSTTNEVIEGIDLNGKTALVTGASAGLGVETVRTLASAGAHVIMVARNEEKLRAAQQMLLVENPAFHLELQVLDLADLDSVRSGGAAILSGRATLDILINNAGVMACPLARTAQGFELQFGTNHLGHFLLTCLLMPALLAAPAARVVSLSSAGHKMAAVNFDDPNYLHRDYHKWPAYGAAKTANALFAVGLEARLGAKGVHAYAVHPGMIVTELGRHLVQEDYDMLTASGPKGTAPAMKTVPQGAASSIWAATSAELNRLGGVYIEDCNVAQPAVSGGNGGVESYAIDSALAEQLWQLSEELLGQSFNFSD